MGDPCKAAEKIYELTELKDPPLRLALGEDCIRAIKEKLTTVIGDLDKALSSPTGYAFIDTFYNATGSHAGASVMTSILIIMLLFGCVTNFATSSRQLWAFVSPPVSIWACRVGWLPVVLRSTL